MIADLKLSDGLEGVRMSNSYTYGSDEGMQAVLRAMESTGEDFEISLNPMDFATVFYALRAYGLTDEDEGNEFVDRSASLLGSIAESYGVEFI